MRETGEEVGALVTVSLRVGRAECRCGDASESQESRRGKHDLECEDARERRGYELRGLDGVQLTINGNPGEPYLYGLRLWIQSEDFGKSD